MTDTKSTKTYKQQAVRIILALLVVVSLVLLVLPFLPVSEERQQQCVAELEYERCYHLDIDGVPAFYLNELSQGTTKTSASTSIDSIAWHREKLKGCWTYRYLFLPICKGRIQAVDPDIEEAEQMEKINANIHDVITRNIELLEKECQRAKRIERGFNYYLKVHNVTDEGYNAIAALSARSLIAGHERERVLEILQAIRPNQLVEIKMQRNYYLVTRDAKGRVKRTPCKPLDKEYDNGVVALQTEKAFMPDAARAIYYNSTTSDFISNSIAPENSAKSLAKEAGKTKPRNGHGILMEADGTYYDGMWEDGKRNGFGFAIDSVGKLRVGEWKDDKYRGERMVYTSDRIYGIDISRYQHDIGKKHYSIDWSKIRITHLGTISNKRINGKVDYPVSFCYIKSTEGATLKNKYYGSDYADARRHGIRCGAYHFFSTKSSATDQANYFLSNTRFNKGDLPPVLDVEPSPSQVKDMGGTEVMLNKVRTWMRIVKEKTGVKPILYVSQSFVNRYLTDANDIKREYKVWIARYGEYKPDIHLAIWQLCPDGRVAGIHGEVDINVFNGYQDEFDKFLKNDLIN